MPDALAGLSPGALLLGIALLLYVTDAAQLLFINEVLFGRAWSGPWRAWLPVRRPELARRYLILPALLRPDITLLRVSWPLASGPPATPGAELRTRIDRLTGNLWPIRLLCLLLLPELFLGMPLLYWWQGDSPAILALLALVYLQTLLLLGWLLMIRQRVGLDLGVWAILAMEALICIPYAINVYRKTSQRCLAGSLDVLDAATTLLPATHKVEFYSGLQQLAGELIDNDDLDAAPEPRLLALRDRAVSLTRGRDS